MFTGKARKVKAKLKGASLSKLLPLLPNIRQGREGMFGTNTLAYYKHWYIVDIKSFVRLG